ncbi:MAG: hypothetical protein QXX30_04705 [Candidatus Aenigmatarchaeota archaeon]
MKVAILKVWRDDFSEWFGGKLRSCAYLYPELKEIFGGSISFYKWKEGRINFWEIDNEFTMAKLFDSGILIDILKILRFDKLVIRECYRFYADPACSRFFGSKDYRRESEYEILLENWELKNQYLFLKRGGIKIVIFPLTVWS